MEIGSLYFIYIHKKQKKKSEYMLFVIKSSDISKNI